MTARHSSLRDNADPTRAIGKAVWLVPALSLSSALASLGSIAVFPVRLPFVLPLIFPFLLAMAALMFAWKAIHDTKRDHPIVARWLCVFAVPAGVTLLGMLIWMVVMAVILLGIALHGI